MTTEQPERLEDMPPERRTGDLAHRVLLYAGVAILAGAGSCPRSWARPARRPIEQSALRAATTNAVAQCTWRAHSAWLDRALLEALPSSTPFGTPSWEPVTAGPVLGLALAQRTLLQFLKPDELDALALEPATAAFLTWLLTNRAALEDLLETVKTEDKILAVARIWAGLWNLDAAGRDKYRNLAFACGLVFDEPLHLRVGEHDGAATVDVTARYQHYRALSERGSLKTRLAELPPWELIWVIDAPVPNAELTWSLKHANYSRRNWAKAYTDIRYRMERVDRESGFYTEYTLAEIKKKGGVCRDQAFFAAITAKANGIPAMALHGEGDRGAHVWLGYKATSRAWNMSAGRYEGDRFATGYATDPQTRLSVKEQSLFYLSDPQRRSGRYRAATRLMWLAFVCAAHGRAAQAGSILKSAVATADRHTAAWSNYIGHLRGSGAPLDERRAAVRAMRTAFRRYPDLIASLVHPYEAELAGSASDAEAAYSAARRQIRRLAKKYPDRSDLVLDGIAEQVRLLEKAGMRLEIDKLYRDALDDFGDQAVMFRSLATRYFGSATEKEARDRALRYIHSCFRRHHRRPAGSDYFALTTQAELELLMARFFSQAGDELKAKRYRRDAAKTGKRAGRLLP